MAVEEKGSQECHEDIESVSGIPREEIGSSIGRGCAAGLCTVTRYPASLRKVQSRRVARIDMHLPPAVIVCIGLLRTSCRLLLNTLC